MKNYIVLVSINGISKKYPISAKNSHEAIEKCIKELKEFLSGCETAINITCKAVTTLKTF